MQLLTIVNRTTKTLEGIWDGRHYAIPPGRNAFPVVQAEAFKRQNPVMGSEDPRTGEVQYLIGIEDQFDDCSPLEQSDAIERWDRKNLGPGSQNVEVVAGRNGIYGARDVASGLPTGLSSKFEK